MRILQLGKFYPIRGGVEKVMHDLTTGLSEKGVECDMLCAAYTGKNRTIEIGKTSRIICCRTWAHIANTMISPELIVKSARICRNYDIVHLHHPDPTACLALFCARFKGKVILHWHSDIIKQRFWLMFYLPLQKWMIRRADLVITTTPAYLEGSSYLKKVKDKSLYLPIGIFPVSSQQDKEMQTLYPGKKIIFSLGRLVPYKGFKYLIRAARYLPEGYIVLIGGEGPLKQALETEIETFGVVNKVKLLGRIREEDLPAYYHGCTLFCLPSVQKTEAFGIVQIEAMSCRKPVVATNIPGSGVPWVNKHGVSGLNVPPKNPVALAEAIMEVTKDEKTYMEYSQNAFERYNTVFTKQEMINRYLNIIKEF